MKLSLVATMTLVGNTAPQPATILLVEDELEFRELLQSVLLSHGYVVEVAGDGRAALNLIEQRRFDLIVTDLCMPGADGMEILMALRERRCALPVLVMSGGVGSNMAGMLHAAHHLGARHTLAKPFALPDFLAAIRELLPAPTST